MHRGAEMGGWWGGRKSKQRREGRQRGGMLGEEEERAAEGEHRVCASGTRRQGKIAWARLAGRVCLCLIEEGCETQTPHWLELYWNAATERWTLTHMLQTHMHAFVQWEHAEHGDRGSDRRRWGTEEQHGGLRRNASVLKTSRVWCKGRDYKLYFKLKGGAQSFRRYQVEQVQIGSEE